MINLFDDIKEAITNTLNVSKRCSFVLKDSKPKLPNINILEDLNESDLIDKLSHARGC